MAKLREVASEAERRRLLERIRTEMRAQIREMLTAEQKTAYQKIAGARDARGAAASGRVWTLQHGEPQPVDLRLGLSDGTSTEVLSGPLKEGDEVVVGLLEARSEGSVGPRMRLF